MHYPKPQKGNPHKLTINQHIFPKACISRFARENGTVQVRRKCGEQDQWVTPGNSYFCARRLWDQKAEAVFMKAIEDRYQDGGCCGNRNRRLNYPRSFIPKIAVEA